MDSGHRTSLLARLGGTSIKSKLTIFALLATLLPSALLGFMFYENNRAVLEDGVSQSLENTAKNQAREIKGWITDRRSELDVLATSYVGVVENLPSAVGGDETARLRIENYLHSVSSRLEDIEALAVTDVTGTVVASSSDSEWQIPGNWIALLGRGARELPFGRPRMDFASNQFLTPLGTPIFDQNQQPVGMLVARLHFANVTKALAEAEILYGDSVYLIEESGRVLASGARSYVAVDDRISQSLRQRLAEEGMVDYWHDDGTEVVGQQAPLLGKDMPDWQVVAERLHDAAFEDVNELERLTILLVLSLLAAIGVIAYLLARGMTAPLSRLSAGAAQVASGDLDVSLEARGHDEIAYLTRVFNEMVEQINEAQGQLQDQNRRLEILSSTDALTGLYNRQHLTQRIQELLEESASNQTPFAVLMLDLDHFKRLNDDHGHLAGDEALKCLADHLRHTLREDDYAARFGGEEFLILLPGLDADLAMKTAERIRKAVSANALEFETGQVRMTVSAGVAVFPDSGRTMDSLIQAADAALYAAKEGGRNRVELGQEPGLRVIQ